MTHEPNPAATKPNPFMDAFKRLQTSRQLTFDAKRLDPELPACPCCGAAALATESGYVAYDRLGHDCNCVVERALAYDAGLLRIWHARHRLPQLLSTLPTRFHDAKTADFGKSPVPMAMGMQTRGRYLWGEKGVGKTHLAAAAGITAAKRGDWVKYFTFADLVQQFRDSVKTGTPRPDLTGPDLLILDDMSYAKPSEFAFEVLFSLTDGRWANKKATIFIANHDALTTARLHTPASLFPSDSDHEATAMALASRFLADGDYCVAGHDRRAPSLN